MKVSTCVDIAKLYETLTLNAIAIFKFISNQPIGDLNKTSERVTLNAIPTCGVASKYSICSLGAPLNEDQGLNAIPACKFILK